MFSMVSIACETLPSMMSSLSCQVSPTVLSALDDSDPAVCQHVWNAVLSVLRNITVRVFFFNLNRLILIISLVATCCAFFWTLYLECSFVKTLDWMALLYH